MVEGRPEPDPAYVARVAPYALALPDAYEEDAWHGVRWRVRTRTFAHVMVMTADRDTYALGVTEPREMISFRAQGEELLALTHAGPPFFKPPWAPGVVGLLLGDDTDWDEVGELVAESYRVLAPARLVRLLDERSRGTAQS
ncbi:MmcQ/YjbR family DNA-binding protein [Nocardioides sp. C4-1]|uniref:MmcQ/YjbR family DNA-binding protein n=1 Tax=Nocardioides sp. C4-1 TaxID=3151851 RepID=UPI0032649C3E